MENHIYKSIIMIFITYWLLTWSYTWTHTWSYTWSYTWSLTWCRKFTWNKLQSPKAHEHNRAHMCSGSMVLHQPWE